MDKSIIKTFATESRNKLIEDVEYRLSLVGITKNDIAEPIKRIDGVESYDIGGSRPHNIFDNDIIKRQKLVEEIKIKGYENFVEEVAYTWFNRIIAIRYMEVNDYLPSGVRVLSSKIPGRIEPDIIKYAFKIDLNYSQKDLDLISKLEEEKQDDELFRFLFIKQCNKLNELLPNLFEKTDDYLELLLNISYSNKEGVVRKLIDSIPEEDFLNQVEIIGWLYQYYISEKKNKVINIYRGKIKKEDIPAATQLFTTDWVVKYMVDNSLGRYWIERNPDSNLITHLDYYLGEAEQSDEIMNQLSEIRSKSVNIKELKFFDPCMGSGHILVYAFDVFFEIYKELGYYERNIPELILNNNIYGLDIDDRAYQLAYFAVLMKARKYDDGILDKNITPNVLSIKESKNISNELIEYIGDYNPDIKEDVKYLKDIFSSGKEFGSLIKINKLLDLNKLENSIKKILDNNQRTIFDSSIIQEILPLINQAKILADEYEIVVTNPPYMDKFEKSLKDFAKKYYKDYSKNLFSMFIFRNFGFCKENGYSAFMTPFVWMFIKNHEKLRDFIINNKSFSSLIQLEYSAFPEATVPICTFVLFNSNLDYDGIFLKLSEFTGGMDIQNEKVLEIISGDEELTKNNMFFVSKSKFHSFPGSTISFWDNDNYIKCFDNLDLKTIGHVKQGLATSDNTRFTRFWYEVDINKIDFFAKSCEDSKNNHLKWFPYNKGGDYRKWYGNHYRIVNWENDGDEIRNIRNKNGKIKSRVQNTKFYFNESISWSKISSGNIAFRYYPEGFIFDVAGCSVFLNNNFYYIFGFLNSNVCMDILRLISPTMNFEVGHISSLPIILNDSKIDEINRLVSENIAICKNDWDDYELSWNFNKHPFLRFKKDNLIENCFNYWKNHKLNMFNNLKSNEIKLNELFSEIYDVESNHSVDDKHVSVTLADSVSDVKSFISYVIGCIFGRYSLDKDGICYAGGEFDLDSYSSFIPDDDNIIPVLDTDYFNDDIVNKFEEFIKISFGEDTLNENLEFLANVLNKNGGYSRDILREYFIKDFFNDHNKMYEYPIYWQFNSGKYNAFNCLVYIHRYTPDLITRIRTDYLHKTQRAIDDRIKQCEFTIKHSSSVSDKSNAEKEKNKLLNQQDEIKLYDEALNYIANQNIELDLDDGVKVNYEKFQKVLITKEGQKTKKINLLKKL